MRFASVPRGALLVVALLAAAGSGSPRSSRTSQTTPGTYAAASYHCFTLQTQKTTTSMCLPNQAGCERERAAAMGDGLATTDCVAWQPIACFQLQGDPSPGAEMCAANLEDCEIWREVDRQKNGRTGAACAWKR